VGVGAQRNAKGTSETEIGELQVAVAVDEQVLRLQVAVEHSVAVAVANALAQLAHELLDDGVAKSQPVQRLASTLRQRLTAAAVANWERLHVLLQIEIEELEDQVELVAIGVDNVEQLHDVRVAHLLEQRDLADGGRRNALIFGFEADLLQRDDAPVVGEVAGLVDDTVSTCVAEGSA